MQIQTKNIANLKKEEFFAGMAKNFKENVQNNDFFGINSKKIIFNEFFGGSSMPSLPGQVRESENDPEVQGIKT